MIPLKYMQYAQRNKGIILLVIGIIAAAAFLYYKGKKAGQNFIPDAKYIQGKAGIPAGYNPNILVDKLFEAMDGLFTLTGTKTAVWRQLLELPSDDMVILIYNTFNKKYGSKGSGTLTEWIKDEVYHDPVGGVKTKVLERLASLRCT